MRRSRIRASPCRATSSRRASIRAACRCGTTARAHSCSAAIGKALATPHEAAALVGGKPSGATGRCARSPSPHDRERQGRPRSCEAERRRDRRGAGRSPTRRRTPGTGGAARRAPRFWRSAADLYEAEHRRASWRCSSARPARRSTMRSPICARRSISCATTPSRRAQDFDAAACACRARPASATSSRCMAAASSPASARGISRWRSSPARSRPRSPPAMRSSPSRPSRRRSSRIEAVQLLHKAGVPPEVLHFLPGDGARIGKILLAASSASAASPSPARTRRRALINRALAARDGAIPPLIAETGGMNAMIVDSSALPEQAVRDVLASAFDSAGQRCSAARVLFVQDDIADRVMPMLEGRHGGAHASAIRSTTRPMSAR